MYEHCRGGRIEQTQIFLQKASSSCTQGSAKLTSALTWHFHRKFRETHDGGADERQAHPSLSRRSAIGYPLVVRGSTRMGQVLSQVNSFFHFLRVIVSLDAGHLVALCTDVIKSECQQSSRQSGAKPLIASSRSEFRMKASPTKRQSFHMERQHKGNLREFVLTLLRKASVLLLFITRPADRGRQNTQTTHT